MTDWAKHGFGPGTDVCARCKGDKHTARRNSKWCGPCDREMKSRRADGALDRKDQGKLTRPTRIHRGF